LPPKLPALQARDLNTRNRRENYYIQVYPSHYYLEERNCDPLTLPSSFPPPILPGRNFFDPQHADSLLSVQELLIGIIN